MPCASRAGQTCTSLGHCPLTPICTVEIAVGRLNPIGVLRKTDERRLRITLDGHRQWRRRHRRSVLCEGQKAREGTRRVHCVSMKISFRCVRKLRNINIFVIILTQFTGLLRTNTVAAKRDLLAERTCLGKSVSVSLRKNGPKRAKNHDTLRDLKGGPEPLEKEIHEILGSKREDRFSDPFFD